MINHLINVFLRNLFIILLLTFVLQACFNTKGNEGFKDHNVEGAFSDTVNFEGIFCGYPLQIDATTNLEEWSNFLRNNLQLDSFSVDTIPAGTFTVLAQFVIDKNGKLGDISIIKDPGYGLGERVMGVMAEYKSLWKPAELNNEAIVSWRRIPVTFIIEEEECKNEILRDELIL